MSRRTALSVLPAVLLLAIAGCASEPVEDGEQSVAALCADPAAAPALAPPAQPPCDNEKLTSYDGLLVMAPHPDDETLAFSGLITAYLEQGKTVQVVIATDGDAYCEACSFWRSTTAMGSTCDAEDLSNLETPAIDSFAEVRRSESLAAMEVLGAGEPTFLGYPDTGLAVSWTNAESGELTKRLRRSDFSACDACETCAGGYGEGPETELTAASLLETLGDLIAGTAETTLLATTHWLDGHGDHAALGRFVRRLNGEMEVPRAIAYGVVHAHTPKDTPHFDCWYPTPRALACPCFAQECAGATPGWLAAMRAHRFRPDWPASLPDDAEYGEESQLCLQEAMYVGEGATKLAAISSYRSQLGFAARVGAVPAELEGIMDCNGYLLSFVRATEAFVLADPRS